jgi:hypothetical protein
VSRPISQLPIAEHPDPEEAPPDQVDDDPTGLAGISTVPPKSKTHSGKRFEACILAALIEAGFEVETQVRIGTRAGSLKEHVVDFVARRKAKTLLVSTKWQNSAGSVEEKVPWEVLCLNQALRGNDYSAGFIVLGGKGWTLRDYFTSPAFLDSMNVSPKLTVATFETFMGRLFRDEV